MPSMSIEDARVIDAVGVNEDSGSVSLMISDHLDWSDLVGHSRFLAAKVNAYVHAVETGQLVAAYPKAAGRRVQIDIIGQYPLTPAAAEYLNTMRSQLAPVGIGLTYGLVDSKGPN